MQLLMTALVLLAPAAAQDDEDFDFIKPDDEVTEDKVDGEDFGLFDDEEDFEIAPPTQVLVPALPGREAMPEAIGAPLADSYPVAVAPGAGSVLIELPVLLSRSGADVAAPYWLGASLWAGDRQLTESWQRVSPEAVPAAAPGFAFFKLQAPAGTPGGTLELRLVRAAAPGGETEALFSKSISY